MSSPWPTDGGESQHSGASTPELPSTPQTAQYPAFDAPLLPPDARDSSSKPPSRSLSATYVSSPLNPNAAHSSPYLRPHAANRLSATFTRVASEEAQALASPNSPLQPGMRGSMVLYRLASDDASDVLTPPPIINNRDSVISSSGASVYTLSSDSKYPAGALTSARGGFVPYAFDPDLDSADTQDDDDFLHQPQSPDTRYCCSCRGIMNISMLLILVFSLLTLFIGYPVLTYYRGDSERQFLASTVSINATGQASLSRFRIPSPIDPDTPDSVKNRTGFDNQPYHLVFSDEFNTDGRTFLTGDDPYWEAVDLWYGATGDQEWYDPKQVTTSNGSLRILLEQVADPSTNHGLPYKSGMLQSWNKLCFTGGYIEVAITLPGADSNATGYWPGAWTMGNLARAGYPATTDGMWPYSYDACDVGTFPNQTYANGTGPAAALFSDQSKPKYNNALSWLSGQRVSACTCSGEDHPGPNTSQGRGAPEIDILEVERNKLPGSTGQVVSQSAQFAPFTHDYAYANDTQDAWSIHNQTITRANTYRGSAVQQAVSALTDLPDDMFQGSGQRFTTLGARGPPPTVGLFADHPAPGFEYWTDPSSPQDGFITWQADGAPTVTMGASALGPDTGDGGSMVSQRRISEEPMSIVFNLAISKNWQAIDLATLEFPAEMRIDYVRVYQRAGQQNINCSPADYPTADYISAHMPAYTNSNLTSWSDASPAGAGYSWPKNSLYDGGC
ncbi:beta-glucan synthesis-associated [Amylocystis lapponica]|nr:beta-glucan synthesis-associated [Amylocystis lapponica]